MNAHITGNSRASGATLDNFDEPRIVRTITAVLGMGQGGRLAPMADGFGGQKCLKPKDRSQTGPEARNAGDGAFLKHASRRASASRRGAMPGDRSGPETTGNSIARAPEHPVIMPVQFFFDQVWRPR